MIFATMFIACADNIVVATPEYTQTEQDSTYTQPIQETTDTTSYHFLFGSVCAALNVQSTGTLTGDSVVNVFVGTWHDKCVLVSEDGFHFPSIDSPVAISTTTISSGDMPS